MTLRIVKKASIEKYPYQTRFSYPYPLDGQGRSFLEEELKRVFHVASMEDYKLLPDTYAVTVALRSKKAQKSFYRTFGRTLSDYSLKSIFCGKQNKVVIKKILTGSPSLKKI